MRYCTLHDLPRPAGANFDAVEIEAAAARALRETHLAMLARMAQVGMELIEAIAPSAQTDPAQACAAGQAYAKVSQAVRRTMALQLKLSREAETDEAPRRAAREQRCADEAEIFREAKTLEIAHGLEDAWASGCSEEKWDRDQAEFGNLLFEAELNLGLDDGDGFGDYLDRPVGETVARLWAWTPTPAGWTLANGAYGGPSMRSSAVARHSRPAASPLRRRRGTPAHRRDRQIVPP